MRLTVCIALCVLTGCGATCADLPAPHLLIDADRHRALLCVDGRAEDSLPVAPTARCGSPSIWRWVT